MSKKSDHITFAFLGTSHIASCVLQELYAADLVPALVITPPAKRQGRKMELSPTLVAQWAEEKNVPLSHSLQALEGKAWDVCVVVDYGVIIPKNILAIPRCGFLNVHPSLLPRLRGPSPIRSAILTDERQSGISVMLLDEKMDHGPILAQSPIEMPQWPPRLLDFETALMRAGGQLLVEVLPRWVGGEIEVKEQDHAAATFCNIIKKEDGQLNLSEDGYLNLLKIRAFEGWPGTYAFFEQNGKKVRVKIIDAHIHDVVLIIDRVIPEGKREMNYEDFIRSGARPL